MPKFLTISTQCTFSIRLKKQQKINDFMIFSVGTKTEQREKKREKKSM